MNILRYLKYQYLRILRLKDSPSKIAKGVALGVALDFLPLPFISLFISWVVARLLGFNAVAAVMTAAALKPAVFAVFFPFNVFVGKLFTENRIDITTQPQVPLQEPDLSFESLNHFFSMETIKALGTPFLIGSGFNALVFFIVVFYLVRTILLRRAERILKKRALKRNEIG